MTQLDMFEKGNNDYLGKYTHSLLLSAVGDSLGWGLEFSRQRPSRPIENYMRWNKLVGGKWWGYVDEINPGEYSDDTQLNLATARAINSSGEFDPEYFAYLELPLWLNYERGGGRSIKTAARNILKKKSTWSTNFYRTKDVDYINAGANGAAMRNLPIALVNVHDEKNFIVDSFKNSIITHGHPRAIIGSILIGISLIYLVKNKEVNISDLRNYIVEVLQSSLSIAEENKDINEWIELQEKSDFSQNYIKTIDEVECFLNNIENHLSKDDIEYYKFTKALEGEYKGSGTSTTAVAIFLILKYLQNPEKALFKAVNMIGSDTDTIASFVGSLIGAYHGNNINSNRLNNLISTLQDKSYFIDVGKFLWKIHFSKLNIKEEKTINKTDAFLKIMAWEIGLNEMFWEALGKGDIVVHPTLGRGEIKDKLIKDIKERDDYVAKIFKIKFDTGQSAYFHSRVSKEGIVQESISRELEKALF
jgi:ADP-ribosylglycohydrolase